MSSLSVLLKFGLGKGRWGVEVWWSVDLARVGRLNNTSSAAPVLQSAVALSNRLAGISQTQSVATFCFIREVYLLQEAPHFLESILGVRRRYPGNQTRIPQNFPYAVLAFYGSDSQNSCACIIRAPDTFSRPKPATPRSPRSG